MPAQFRLTKKRKLCRFVQQADAVRGVVRLLHSLEGPDQVVQVGGDVVHGELQRADDFTEAKHNTHGPLMLLICVCVELNRSQQMQ